MVEVYRKGDFQKPDRRKANRDRRVHPRYIFFADCELTDHSTGSYYENRVTTFLRAAASSILPSRFRREPKSTCAFEKMIIYSRLKGWRHIFIHQWESGSLLSV
jgi:hypothetical protein